MEQTDNDIFPEKEKEKAKRKKIAEMNAVTAQAILGNILNQFGAKYEQYHIKTYSVLIIPIGECGIEIRLLDSAIIKPRKAVQEKLAKLFDFISGGASIEEVVTYCHYNSFTYLGYKARKYAVIDKTKKYTATDSFHGKHKDYSFESAFVPEGVTSIEEGAFGDCESLKSIQLPVGLQSIGEWAFGYCVSLESIQLPKGLQSIGEEAFLLCQSLKSIQLPEGVTSIGKNAFSYCGSLKSIKIPAGLRSIEDRAFWGCSGLVSIIVDSNNPVYDSRENCNAIIETATGTLIVGCQNTVIPAGVTSIGSGAFEDCTSLESIQLPEGVTSIGSYVFRNCTSLESIQLPEGLQSIRDGAFWGCTSLKSIQLPAEVTSIAGWTFSDCKSLENITFDGTKEQWEKIVKGDDWHKDIPAKVVHCSDGEIEI